MLIAMAGALWVALVASIAALIGAIASPLSNWLVATAAHRHERKMRLREDKIVAYTSLLRECRRRQLVVGELQRLLTEGADPATPVLDQAGAPDLDTFLNEAALTLAVASDEVSHELDQFEEILFTLKSGEYDFDDPSARPGVLAAVMAINVAMNARYDSMAKTIRDELAT